MFYLADEGVAPGKGANTVISYVHHYLGKYGLGEITAQFHFDNSCGQNKNNAVLWYALWRVMTGNFCYNCYKLLRTFCNINFCTHKPIIKEELLNSQSPWQVHTYTFVCFLT